MAHSGVIGLVLEALQESSGDEEITLALTTTCRDLSYALVTSKQLTLAGLFDIISLLLDNDARSSIINILVEVPFCSVRPFLSFWVFLFFLALSLFASPVVFSLARHSVDQTENI